MKWIVKPTVEFRRLGGEGVAMDVASGKFYRLSPEAADCFAAIMGGAELGESTPGLAALRESGLLEGTARTSVGVAEAHIVEYQAFTVYASHCGTYTTKGSCNGDTQCTWTGTGASGSCGPIAPHT